MSQTMTSEPGNDFSYRPVPVSAPVSLIIGIFSLFGLLTELLVPLPLIGTVVAFLSARNIKRSNGEYAGLTIARAGLVLNVLLMLASPVWHVYGYAQEVPEGFVRLNFSNDISKKGFVFSNGVNSFHDDVKPLDGKPIFLKGYMYPDGRGDGIRDFIFCRDSGQCCFGGDPELTDMIQVIVPERVAAAKFFPGLVSVAGTFRLRDLRRAGNLLPAYEIEATLVEPARKFW